MSNLENSSGLFSPKSVEAKLIVLHGGAFLVFEFVELQNSKTRLFIVL